jgi:hypothetical protein
MGWIESSILPALDLRHVEHVVDQREQQFAAAVDQVEVLAIARGLDRAEQPGTHDVGKADDAVQRRAQLVAHMGEEAGLRAAAVLGGDPRLAQLLGRRHESGVLA